MSLTLGLDIGSTTAKAVLLDGENILFKKYERHYSKVRQKCAELVGELAPLVRGRRLKVAIAGSAGLGICKATNLAFVQEVFATARAVEFLDPKTDVVIELGGEDAKILFLTGGSEERMNGSCAGGTGAFIDQMLSLLNLTAEEFDAAALAHTKLYPVASRCGVFAKTDVQPLLNQGANKADIAASIFQAVADQTIGGLAQGRKIKGRVMFLGGPLFYFKGLQERFKTTLKLADEDAVFHPLAQFAVGIGAAMSARLERDELTTDELLARLEAAKNVASKNRYLAPLFKDEAEFRAFRERHARASVEIVDLDELLRARREQIFGANAGTLGAGGAGGAEVCDSGADGINSNLICANNPNSTLTAHSASQNPAQTGANSNLGGASGANISIPTTANPTPANNPNSNLATNGAVDASANGANNNDGADCANGAHSTAAVPNKTTATNQAHASQVATSQAHASQAATAPTAQTQPPITLPESQRLRVFLGVDCGSTTTKLVLIDEQKRILHQYYSANEGNPVEVVRRELEAIYARWGGQIRICGAASTGYGEELIKAGFCFDDGLVETLAHLKAAQHFNPAVDSIIDIGGQDIKCFFIKNGVIGEIMLNEACSSGCGSFISSFASSMGYEVAEFSTLGLASKSPVELGSRCTVFMNSSVKEAQKEGASIEDISAGLSMSVVKNAIYKVIRARSADEIGKNIVVQGGTFLNEAVLRSFELELGREVIRPTISGVMGAYGAALHAQELGLAQSSVLTSLADFTHTAKPSVCKLCGNNCNLTINRFGGGASGGSAAGFAGSAAGFAGGAAGFTGSENCAATSSNSNLNNNNISNSNLNQNQTQTATQTAPHSTAQTQPTTIATQTAAQTQTTTPSPRRTSARFISGNRCDKPLGLKKSATMPNLFEYKLNKLRDLIAYKNFDKTRLTRGKIGIPLGLNIYENLPFWHTLLSELGFEVVVSEISTRKTLSCGQATIPSDTVCYPAKLLHGHIEDLLARGVERIFYPCMSYGFEDERDTSTNRYNCPVVAYYPELLRANVEDLRGIKYDNPYFGLHKKAEFRRKGAEYFVGRLLRESGVRWFGRRQFEAALDRAYAAREAWAADIARAGEEVVARVRAGEFGAIILSGRPYHIDPEINHGIDKLITSLGVAVLSEDSVAHLAHIGNDELGVLNQWSYHSRLYSAARFATQNTGFELVQLVSFGCGIDSITTDEVREILEREGRFYTQLKIDEISNLGAVKIRIRSLLGAIESKKRMAARAAGVGAGAGAVAGGCSEVCAGAGVVAGANSNLGEKRGENSRDGGGFDGGFGSGEADILNLDLANDGELTITNSTLGKNVAAAAADDIGADLQHGATRLKSAATAAAEEVKSAAASAANSAATAAKTAASEVKATALHAAYEVKSAATATANEVKNAAISAASEVKSAAKEVKNSAKNAVISRKRR